MHQRPVPVQKLLLVDGRGVADKETLFRGHHGVLQNVGAQLVDVQLRVLADGHIAEADGRALLRVHHVQHHRVHTVVIKAPLPVLRVVLAGVQQRGAHEFDVVQRRPAIRCLDLVIPVHHHALVAGVHVVVVDVLLHVHDLAFLLALQLRVLAVQQVVVHQVYNKQVPALLDVRDARLPKQLQQVDIPYLDVAQSIVLLRIPEDAVHRRAVLQLLPPVV